MTARQIGKKIQWAFEWVQDLVQPIENRWIVMTTVVLLFLVMKALGVYGLADIITVIYIMYWVTFRGPMRERDD